MIYQRRTCSDAFAVRPIPLARIPKFVYANNETFHADIEVSHFGAAPLESAKTVYTIKDKFRKSICSWNCRHPSHSHEIFILGSVDMTLEGSIHRRN